MSRVLTLALIGLAFLGCKPEPKEPTGSSLPAPPAASPGTLKQITGAWTIALTDAQHKELEGMSLAFRDPPPDEVELEKAPLTDLQRAQISAIVELRKKRPDDPQLKEARQLVGGMGQSSLVIATSSLSMSVGGMKEQASFTVLTETASTVKLLARVKSGRQETLVIKLLDAGAISLTKPDQPDALIFKRP